MFLWDVATGVTTRRLPGHMGKVHVVDFNEDATVLASGNVVFHFFLYEYPYLYNFQDPLMQLLDCGTFGTFIYIRSSRHPPMIVYALVLSRVCRSRFSKKLVMPSKLFMLVRLQLPQAPLMVTFVLTISVRANYVQILSDVRSSAYLLELCKAYSPRATRCSSTPLLQTQ